jgi:hypothetical protein
MADHDTHDHTGIPGVGTTGDYTATIPWTSGTSFPGGPGTNDRCTRTDLTPQDYFYDGTRWRSITVFEMEATGANASANGDIAYRPPFGGANKLWLIDFIWTYAIGSPHSGSQFWDLVLHKYEAGGGTDTVVATLTSDLSSTIWVNPAATAIGAEVALNIDLLYMSLVKHSTVGNINCGARLRYQIIAT